MLTIYELTKALKGLNRDDEVLIGLWRERGNCEVYEAQGVIKKRKGDCRALQINISE